MKPSRRYVRMKKDPEVQCHPLVRQLLSLMDERKVTHKDFLARAGFNVKLIWYWKRCFSPRVVNLENAFNALGYTLKAVPKEDAQ